MDCRDRARSAVFFAGSARKGRKKDSPKAQVQQALNDKKTMTADFQTMEKEKQLEVCFRDNSIRHIRKRHSRYRRLAHTLLRCASIKFVIHFLDCGSEVSEF